MLYTVSQKWHCFGLLQYIFNTRQPILIIFCRQYGHQYASIISRLAISFSRHGIQHDWKDTISGVHVSPGSAETLIRRGGETNHHLIAYSLSNISAKNYQNRLICLKVCNISVVLLRHIVVGLHCTTSHSTNTATASFKKDHRHRWYFTNYPRLWQNYSVLSGG